MKRDEQAIEHNRRWEEEHGRDLTCPGCGHVWREEVWRASDGPCADGQFYCTGCLQDDKCGCDKEVRP